MFEVEIGGMGRLGLAHLVLDYNGTLALCGTLLPGVSERLAELSGLMTVTVVTADTFGTVEAALAGLPVAARVLGRGAEDEAKLAVVRELGPERVVAVGNGRNDRLMLKASALGLAVIGHEGACLEAILAADAVFTDIRDALDALLEPGRLRATLRV